MSMLSVNINRSLTKLTSYTGKLSSENRKRSRIKTKMINGFDYICRGIYYVYRNHRYLTAAKLINMAIANIEYKLKRESLWSRPYQLKIESTNICNTNCQLCPTGQGFCSRKKGVMSFDKYKGLVDKLKWHTLDLDLSMWGDPLIVPDIYKMIQYAHDNGIWTYISSNLHAFKIEAKRGEAKDHATQLIESGLELLTCSLHGASQETYSKYQPDKCFNSTIDKIKHIISTRNKMGRSTPAIQLNFVVTKHNEHEIKDFKTLASNLGCKAIINKASYNVRFLNKDKKLQPLNLSEDELQRKTINHLKEWMPLDSKHVIKPYLEMQNNGILRKDDYNGRKPFPCSWPWLSCVVNWDGQVSLCCGSFDKNEDMGNVFNTDFFKIWNNKAYKLSRRSFIQKLNTNDATTTACSTCPGYML